MFYFYPYLGKIPILTNIFQMGWNHQLEKLLVICSTLTAHVKHHHHTSDPEKVTLRRYGLKRGYVPNCGETAVGWWMIYLIFKINRQLL